MRLCKLILITMLLAPMAAADPLPDMAGAWRGSGWAKQTPQGPQEAVRCQISNAYDNATSTLTMSGQCVVPGRKLQISGRLVGDTTGGVTGRWANPDGFGSVAVRGIQQDGLVAFTFSANDGATGRSLAQNVEWRVQGKGLRLRSADRSQPDLMMSDILFNR